MPPLFLFKATAKRSRASGESISRPGGAIRGKMALTTRSARPVIGHGVDAPTSEDDVLIRRSSSTNSDGDGDYERGSPSKHRSRPKKKKFTRSISSLGSSVGGGGSPKVCARSESRQFDAEAYLDKRVMTPTQEWANAITMIPGMIYSVYFIVAGCWMTAGGLENDQFQQQQQTGGEWADLAREAFGNEHGWMESFGCVDSAIFPHMTALPPLTVAAAAVGTLVHSPFSMLFHWYATTVHPSKRIKHWSRRLDHSFIYFASACASYATSGRLDYFLVNAALNLDCAYRQFEEEVRPRRNLVRTASSIVLYLLPVLVYGHYDLFLQFLLMFGVGFWLFVRYPVGGWSHSLFHLILAFLPHLVMTAACRLESSQVQISLAAKCAGIAR